MFVLLWHHLKHTHSHSRSASVQIKLHTCHTFIVWRIWNDDSNICMYGNMTILYIIILLFQVVSVSVAIIEFCAQLATVS